MDAGKIQRQAEGAALEQIQKIFSRPDALENLDQIRKKAERKKAAVEAMLRTAVQSQLEGIRTALGHLQTATEDVKEIEKSTQRTFEQLQTVPELKQKIKELSSANITYSQYAAAMENLKHIFNITGTIEKTHELINKVDLLAAHKNIMELENARDDLMFEVHKIQSSKTEYDKNLLKRYFADVEQLVQDLGKQVFYICSRALEAVQGMEEGPQKLVSSLRIIEREERIDKYYSERLSSNDNFMPPGRPRKWRSKLYEVLSKNVTNRVEGNQLQDRSTNKQWLAVYLEVCRKVVVEDLKVVKSGIVQCFPPEYKIYDRYINMYHSAISKRLREIATDELEKNELVQLLGWVQSYGGPDVLGNTRLGISTAALLQEQPLLSRITVNQLYDRYIEITKKDIHDWLEKALHTEKDDWYKHSPPEEDNHGCFYTALPSILFGMVEDTVAVTKEISVEVIPRVIDAAIDEFLTFSTKYKDATMAYKVKHFENREFFKRYTATLIAVANNLDICAQSTDKLEKHIRLTMESDTNGHENDTTSPRSITTFGINRQELIQKIEHLKKNWNFSMQSSVSSLLDEVYEDIQKHLSNLLTRQWLMGSEDRDTICITIMDYFDDYQHLRPHIRFVLLEELLFKVVGEYIVAINDRRLTYSNYDERHLCAERLREDSEKIEELFSHFLERSGPMITTCLRAVADILDLRDKTLLTLETSQFVRKYPDIHAELLTALINSREDVNAKEAKAIAEEALDNGKFNPKGDKDMVKLFSFCRLGGRRTLPALEETMQNMFATLVFTTTRGAH
uniref:Exocyst complex component Sec6 n=1 Tax=Panagrolaimus superbus TaxID=310955 RepID=A0A914Z9C5_9BILA